MAEASTALPKTTLRTRLSRLEGDNLIEKRGREGAPGIAEHALTESGRDVLVVIASLDAWLARMPDGPLLFDDVAGGAAVKSLSDSWSSMVLHGVAAGPISLSGLANQLRAVPYPSVERRLAAMRRTGQIEAKPDGTNAIPYVLTEWMRRGVAPLAASVHWEQLHLAGAAQSMSRVDVDAAFLLALPLLEVESTMAGSCRMDVKMDDDQKGPAGATVVVAKGKVVSCAVEPQDFDDSWATGTQPAWASTMTSSSTRRLRLGGDQPLAKALLADLRLVLFAPPPHS